MKKAKKERQTEIDALKEQMKVKREKDEQEIWELARTNDLLNRELNELQEEREKEDNIIKIHDDAKHKRAWFKIVMNRDKMEFRFGPYQLVGDTAVHAMANLIAREGECNFTEQRLVYSDVNIDTLIAYIQDIDIVHGKIILQIILKEITENIQKSLLPYKVGRVIAHLIDKGAKNIVILPIIKFPTDSDEVTIRKLETNRMLSEIADTTKSYDATITYLKEFAAAPLWSKHDITYKGKYLNRHYAPQMMDLLHKMLA